MKKKLLATVLTAALAFGAITGCGSQKTEETAATDSNAATTTSETTASTQEAEVAKDGETRVVKLGLTGVIYEDIWNPIKEKLAGEGIDLQYVQFSDFSLPNAALDAGEIDINAFQHHAYFNNDTVKNGYDLTAIGDTFGQCFKADFSKIKILDFIVVLFAFLFVDIFDTLGTLIGVSTKAGMLDENEKLPNIKPALLADAIATSAGAIIGTSTTTTYVESSAGVGAGARTGLASVVTAVLFLLAIFFAPIFTAIPGFATAPALIFVGFLMLSSVVDIDFNDLTEAVPAYMTILAMPFAYSIAEGISLGVISYVVINVICGKAKKVTPLMYVLAVLFVCKYIFL